MKHVLGYFLRNPAAAESLEGVARWRLQAESVHRTVAEADHALRWLVSRGLLRELPTSAAGSMYALNPARRTEAERLLDAWTLPPTERK